MPLPKQLPTEIESAIGAWSAFVESPLAVEAGFIDHWCEVFEDANPRYAGDASAASSRHDVRIAPPMAIISLTTPYAWRPPAARPSARAQASPNAYAMLRRDLGLTGAIGLGMKLEWREPIRLGDRLSSRGRVAAIEGPLACSVGEGYRVRHHREFVNQHGALVASTEPETYIYRLNGPLEDMPLGLVPGIYADLSGYRLPEALAGEPSNPALEFANPRLMHYHAASALRDWNAWHIDDDFARAQGGIASMYSSMLFLMALLNRFTSDAFGPAWALRKVEGRINGLIHPGDNVRIEGAVVGREPAGDEETVTLATVMRTERVTVMQTTLTLARS